ncbi:CaiB/BaiF CoA transferase family protein [Gordonibacter sp.]|uniref:CaiB/BaiF CoA transferase family protein n=1 Tax=Gordonibacter sp. TaxID=1968902 RepID=UPI002FCC8E1C
MTAGALADLKILDFSTLLPGPFASVMLADMGAEVLKISSPAKGDLVTDGKPECDDFELTANHMWLNRNKDTLALNLKTPEAIKIVKELVASYYEVIEQFRPGVMDRLGLSYEVLSVINPKLIYCSVSAYGQTGPARLQAGHDINFLAKSGLMSYSGRKEGGPNLWGTQVGDLAVSLYANIAILAAVNYRRLTGEGQYLDVSMFDGLIPFNATAGISYLMGASQPTCESMMLSGGSAYDFYETADGKYLAVGSVEPKFWENLCEVVGAPHYAHAYVFTPQTLEAKCFIAERFKEKTLDEWMLELEGRDCCVEPVLDMNQCFNEDEHVKERELIVELDVDGKSVRQYALPIVFSKSKPCYRHVGKHIGADTEKTLLGLGYSKAEIGKLASRGVFD